MAHEGLNQRLSGVWQKLEEWKPVFVETSLNLRIEKGKAREDYSLVGDVALSQLQFSPDIIANVEDMECDSSEYDALMSKEYKKISATEDRQRRGVSCWVRKEFEAERIHFMTDPHFMHVRIGNGKGQSLNLIVCRMLVSSGGMEDYQDRHVQWLRVMDYLDSQKDLENIVVTGDWNHGVIAEKENYVGNAREFFNYQMIEEELRGRGIAIVPIQGFSFMGYMKIDHLAISQGIRAEEARYAELFPKIRRVGIPDHRAIVATLCI